MPVLSSEILRELDFSPKIRVDFIKADKGLKICFDGKSVTVYYAGDKEYCRAILLIKSKGFSTPYEISETCAFDQLGLMVDCSRNAVPKVTSVKKMLRIMALCGYNQLMLYTEDTYEVDGEQYFGYLRGRYSQSELKDLDGYAESLGIELIPCIQTLAHLNTIKYWGEYENIIDCNDILLVENERTYKLIENMFSSLRKCYKTDKVHIGMDEARLLGRGKYFDKNGYRDQLEVFNRHLVKVKEIAEKYGFKPMIWSDMFFRSVSGGEYNRGKPLSDNLLSRIKTIVPAGVDLVAWKYDETKDNSYKEFIESHKKIIGQKNLVFANGLWSWDGFVPHYEFALQHIEESTRSCVEYGVKRLINTAWGDDGAECSLFSVIPLIVAQAQFAYNDFDVRDTEAVFFALTGVEYKSFLGLEQINMVGNYKHTIQNPSKYMLYNDLMLGLLDCLVVSGDKDGIKKFIDAVKPADAGEYSYLFESLKSLAEVVYLKYDAGVALRDAYRKKDRKKLKKFADDILPELIDKTEKFYLSFRARWYRDNKPFGFDVQDIRIGGLIRRIKNTVITLNEYLDGKTEVIAELEENILNFHCNVDYDKSILLNLWKINATCNVL